MFLDNEEQMRAKIESVTAAKGAPPVVYEGPESTCTREDADIEVYALHLGSELKPLLARVMSSASRPRRCEASRSRTSRSPRRRSASPRRACLRPLTPSPMSAAAA